MTAVSFSADTTVDRIIFSPGAGSYTITPVDYTVNLTISGKGVINKSGVEQNLGNGNIGIGGVLFAVVSGATVENLVTFNATFAFGTGASGGSGNFLFHRDFNELSMILATTERSRERNLLYQRGERRGT